MATLIDDPRVWLGQLADGSPIYWVRGFAPEDDPGDDPPEDFPPEDDPEEDDPEDDPEEGGDPPADYTPPSREEWERTQAALSKANGEAKKHRLKVRELTRDREEAQRNKERADAAARGESEAYEKALAAAAEAEQRYKPMVVKSAARAAFLEAGLQHPTPDRLARMIRMLNQDEIDVDDDGTVVGLDTQVEQIKSDYEELFRATEPPAPRKRRVHRIDAGNPETGDSSAPVTTGEKIAAQVLGNGGW